MRKLKVEELNRKSAAEFRESPKIKLVAVLENIRSAYNVGSVLRTADAFLMAGVFTTGYTAHPPHRQIAKTALGADETVSTRHFATTAEAIRELREQGYRIFAAEQAERSIPLQQFEILPGQGIAVLFGNEVTGVDQSSIQLCDGCLEIPQLGMKHSINVSVAAGIILWEMAKEMLKPVLSTPVKTSI
jgi:23S rRNA (guanosine2251-2'-O)-methyltransferase